MTAISHEAFESITGEIVKANLMRNLGKENEAQLAAGGVVTLLGVLGLDGVATVGEIPYRGSMRFELQGPGGSGVSYVIGSDNVIFHK